MKQKFSFLVKASSYVTGYVVAESEEEAKQKIEKGLWGLSITSENDAEVSEILALEKQEEKKKETA